MGEGGVGVSQKEGNGKYPHGFALSDIIVIYIRKFFIIGHGGGVGTGKGENIPA